MRYIMLKYSFPDHFLSLVPNLPSSRSVIRGNLIYAAAEEALAIAMLNDIVS